MPTSTLLRRSTTATLAAALAVPAAAGAHVTLQPNTVTEGTYPELAVRVPTESDTASTVKVAVQFPDGFAYAAYSQAPGWKVTVKKVKLATPIKTDDGEITEQVKEMTWTGTGSGAGAIAPGQFKDFPIQVGIPGKAGDTLTFKAVQTYSDGEVVRWIGTPDADKPAPTVKLLPAADTTNVAASTPASANPAPVATADGASKGLGIAALVVGILGALLGAAALVRSGRRA